MGARFAVCSKRWGPGVVASCGRGGAACGRVACKVRAFVLVACGERYGVCGLGHVAQSTGHAVCGWMWMDSAGDIQ